MTVQELINKLQEFEPETKVVFTHLDHTDWLYKVEMSEHDISLGDMSSDDYDGDEDLYDDDDNYIGPQVVEFSLSLD